MMRRTLTSLFVVLCGLFAAGAASAGDPCCDSYQGLTPGYWKNHVEDWPDGICPSTPVGCVFACVDPSLASKSLLQALSFKGGSGITGAQEVLLRASVAALLNAESLCYPLTTGEVICGVNEALCSGNRDYMLYVAAILDEFNNLGAP